MVVNRRQFPIQPKWTQILARILCITCGTHAIMRRSTVIAKSRDFEPSKDVTLLWRRASWLISRCKCSCECTRLFLSQSEPSEIYPLVYNRGENSEHWATFVVSMHHLTWKINIIMIEKYTGTIYGQCMEININNVEIAHRRTTPCDLLHYPPPHLSLLLLVLIRLFVLLYYFSILLRNVTQQDCCGCTFRKMNEYCMPVPSNAKLLDAVLNA